MANLPLSGLPQGTTLENNATIVTVQTVGSTVVNQRVPKALFFSQAIAGALIAANNLSDIANAAIALSNLGVHNLNYSSGTTAPANSLGNIGDFAFNDNFEWYEKTAAATWTLRVNAVTTAEMTTAITTAVTTATTGMLTQTVADTRYAPLGESPGSGARYNFSVSTTLASIASGEIRFSSGTLSSVTSIAIHESDRNGGSMTTILDTIGVGSKLQIAFDASEETYCWFNVTAITDNGSYRTYTVNYLATGSGTIAAGEVTLGIFGAAPSTPTTTSGGATGLQYIYLASAGTPSAGQIRSANIAVSGSVTINPTDAQTKSAADVLARLKVGAIIDLSKDGSNRIRATVTTDYNSTNNSFAIGTVVSYGSLLNNDAVFLSIVSDAPPATTSGGGTGLTAQVITASTTATDGIAYICDSNALIEVTAPSAGTTFAVSNRGTGGFKVRAASGQTLQFGTDAVNTATKFLANSNQFSYVEFFALNSTVWIVKASANIVFGADVVSFTKALLHFNTAVGSSPVDEVSASRVITLSGGAAIATGGKFGNGLNIANTGSYAEFTINDPLGTNDFCLEWFGAPASNLINNLRQLAFVRGTDADFTQGSGATPADGVGPFLTVTGTEVLVQGGTSFVFGDQFSTGGVTTNGSVFTHYALVRLGNVITLYGNGAVQSSGTANTSFATTYGSSLGVTPFKVRFGARHFYNTLAWIGMRDELRLTIGDPVYTAAFTPPTAEFIYTP